MMIARKSPPGIRRLLLALLLIPVLTLIQTIFVVNLELWRLPLASMIRGFAVGIPVLFLISIATKRMSSWTLPAWKLLSVVWVLDLARTAYLENKVALAFFAVLLAAYLVAWTWRATLELSRSYIDPKLNWFESSPPTIPIVQAEFLGHAFNLARIDREGIFAFVQEGQPSLDLETDKNPIEITIRRNDNRDTVNALGEIVRAVHPRRMDLLIDGNNFCGFGLRFVEPGVDRKKELGDFIERLRGEGHVR